MMLKGDLNEMKAYSQRVVDLLRMVEFLSDKAEELIEYSKDEEIEVLARKDYDESLLVDRAYVNWDAAIADAKQRVQDKWAEVAEMLHDMEQCRKVILGDPTSESKGECNVR